MPITDKPTARYPDRKTVTFYDLKGTRKPRVFKSARAAHTAIAKHAGPKSAFDLRQVPVPIVVEWWLAAQAKRLTPSAARTERNIVRPWLADRFGDRAFGSLTIADFGAIKSDMKRRKYKANTILAQLRLFAQLTSDAQDRGFIHFNPAAIAVRSAARRTRVVLRPDHPSEPELGKIRSACHPVALAAVDCMADGGATPTELVRMRPGDCDFRGRTVFLRGTPTHYDEDGAVLARTVPMSDRMAASLTRLLALRPREAVAKLAFGLEDGSHRQASDLQRHVMTCQLRAGITGAPTIHSQAKALRRKRIPTDVAVIGGKYHAPDFRNAAALRWSKTHGLSKLAELLGITGIAAAEKYGYIYGNRRSRKWTIENPAGF